MVDSVVELSDLVVDQEVEEVKFVGDRLINILM